jgi:uncharacterized membrane protein
MTKEERFQEVLKKLTKAPHVEFNLDAVATFCMVAAMRLALSHPHFKGSLKMIVGSISDKLSEALIREQPTLKEFLDDMANNPEPADPASQQSISE